jgi:segregation and condensation protein A
VSTPKATARKRAQAAADKPPAEPPLRAKPAPARRAPEGNAPAEATAPADGAASAVPAFEGQYRVEIPAAGFEGPLDLLLHLIQQHELDILDIPIGFITERFLAYLALMRTLTIDLASEYLVMAATLAHIKSKMLLPSVPPGQEDDGLPGDEEEDPRAELVRRLLEYQKYKAAAADLAERGTLGKDVFTRGAAESAPEGPAPFAPPGVFSLLDAFEQILKKANVKLDHEVVFDRISITDRIVEITEKLQTRRRLTFEDLLLDPSEGGRPPTRFDIVITFLALLEMCKLRMLRVYQSGTLAPIHLEMAVQEGTEGAAAPADGEGSAEIVDVEPSGEAELAPEDEGAS